MAAPATNTEHTRQTNRATTKVRTVDSFCLDIACQPPLDIGLNDKVVDQRCKQVGEQDRQHHAFREGWVDHTDHHHHHADQGTENPLAGIGHGRRHRVGGHKEHTERKTTHHQMPVPRHGKHRVGARAEHIEQQAKADHAQHHAGNDAPGGDFGNQQNAATNKDRQSAGFTHGTVNGADESIHPGDAITHHVLNATSSRKAQRGCAGEAVNRSPDCITGHLRRVGEEQEGTTSQCRVEEVLASTAKHFLANHHAETDTQRDLPKRNTRRQNQGEQHGGHEEAFVDLMLADRSEQHFPETADDKRRGIHWQEVGRALDKVIPQAVGVEPGQRTDQREAPAFLSSQQLRTVSEDQVGLITGVPHPEKHHREGTQPHSDHHALEVDTVTHVSSGLGYAARAIEESIDSFIEGVPVLELAAFFEVVLDFIEECTNTHDLTLLLNTGEVIAQNRAVLILAGTHVGAQRQVFFVELQTAQFLSHLGVTDDQVAQQLCRQDIQRHHGFVVTHRHHGARAAIGSGGEGELLSSVELGNKDVHHRVLVYPGTQVMHQLALVPKPG